MKSLQKLAVSIFTIVLFSVPLSGRSAEEKKADKAKPYPLTTCITDDEKLGSMGAPYVFTYQGREIKLCCSGCLDDFKKDPAKYIKKLEAAEKKAKK